MSSLIILSYLGVGLAAGLSAGIFGVGGGIIIVPALVWLLPQSDIPAEIVMHTAVATSLLVMIPTALSSSVKHFQQGNVQTALLGRLGSGILLGSIMGVLLANALSRNLLQSIFGVFELLVAYQLLMSRNSVIPLESAPKLRELPLIGVLIGGLSSLLGIGGGTMTVPYLNWRGINMRIAIGSSAACGLIIAVVGAATFAFMNHDQENNLSLIGYIYLPAAFVIALTSVISARFGAALSMRLPVPLLKRLFALLLIVVALRMLL